MLFGVDEIYLRAFGGPKISARRRASLAAVGLERWAFRRVLVDKELIFRRGPLGLELNRSRAASSAALKVGNSTFRGRGAGAGT